jgi:L-cystine transport system substrate-binding protein
MALRPTALVCLFTLGAVVRGAPAADLAAVKAAGVLRPLVSADEAPEMFSFTPGPSPGFEREILEGFAQLHRLRLQVVKVARFDDAIPALLKGEGDVVTGINDTEARRKQMAFTVEILPSRHLAVTRKPRVLKSAADLAKERVGVVSGTTWADSATSAGVPASGVEAFGDVGAMLEGLRSNRVTAVVMSLSDFALLRRKEQDLLAGPFLGEARRAAWALRKTDPELVQALNDYVENMRRTPSWSRLAVKYFGEDALTLLGRAHQE